MMPGTAATTSAITLSLSVGDKSKIAAITLSMRLAPFPRPARRGRLGLGNDSGKRRVGQVGAEPPSFIRPQLPRRWRWARPARILAARSIHRTQERFQQTDNGRAQSNERGRAVGAR